MILELRKRAEKLFTKVFYKVRKAWYSKKRFTVNYGGSGTSKSVSQHQSELINLMRVDFNILIMRKVGADLYDSSFMLLREIAEQWGITDQFEWAYSGNKRHIRYKKTGRRIIFRGADDISKIKSIARIGRIVLEEADAFTFDDLKEINRRIRGIEDVQIVFILNPVDEEHFIKIMYVDEPDGVDPLRGVYHDDTYVIVSTYHDNQFLTAEDIRQYELMKLVDLYDYEVYVLAKWGRIKTGAEFYPQFSIPMHVTPVPFIPSLPIHSAWDFNAVPYMTHIDIQYVETEDEIQFRVFQEYCLESPLNSVEACCQALIDDFEKWLFSIFYYGDASGRSKIAGKGDEVNYDDVRKYLARWLYGDASDRTRPSNIGVMIRRKVIMKCLAGVLYMGSKKVRIMIDPSCVKTIEDFRKVKLGQNGKLKKKIHDKRTGTDYEPYGHCTDAVEYCFCEIFESLL